MDPNDSLPPDLLRQIVQGGSGGDDTNEKANEKTPRYDREGGAVEIAGMDENLAKIVALRSRGVSISDGDLAMTSPVQLLGEAADRVVIEFGPDEVPGAYSGASGTEYDRMEKGPLPRCLLGDATSRSPTHPSPRPPRRYPPLRFDSHTTTVQLGIESKRHCWVAGGVSLLLAAIVVVVVPIVLLVGGNDSHSSADLVTEERIRVPNLTQYTLDALQDPDSYQSLAYQWIDTNPYWEEYEPWRQQQRFAMACVFFALEGPTWCIGNCWGQMFSQWMEENLDECAWQVHTPLGGCNTSTGRLIKVGLNRHDRLRGVLPRELYLLTDLRELDFSRSTIKQSVDTTLPPDAIASLPALQTLNLSDCFLTGTIPSTLGRLTGLTSLDLSKNDLKSSIPSDLGLLFDLSSIFLAGNDLNGTIPKELGDLSLLREFTIEENTQIEDSLPEGFCAKDRARMEVLRTDWCRSMDECC